MGRALPTSLVLVCCLRSAFSTLSLKVLASRLEGSSPPSQVATKEMIEYHFQSCLLSARQVQDRFILILAIAV